MHKQKKDSIEHTISEIKKSIEELNKILDSNDISSISTYKFRNAEFRRLPSKLTITLPSFIPQKLFKEQIGSLSAVSIKTDEQGYISSPDRPLIDEQRVVKDINTQYTASIKLRGASCLSDENVWTCGFDEQIMKLYNLKGELVKKNSKQSQETHHMT